VFEILLNGLMGGVAAGVAVLIARALVGPKEKPGAHRALLAFFTLCGFYAANQTLAPQVRTWKRVHDVDKFLRTDPLYSVLLADNPALSEPLRGALVKALETGHREEAVAAGRTVVAAVLPSYLPKASDDALVTFTTSMLRTLRGLASADPNRCYRYLFPKVAGPPSLGKDDGQDELLNAMRLVVESARSRQQPQPEPPDASQSDMEEVLGRLAVRHGQDVLLLQQPEAPNVDRAKVCALAIDLYSEVLTLPAPRAARVLRVMYAQ
jgi:hypothetical protein